MYTYVNTTGRVSLPTGEWRECGRHQQSGKHAFLPGYREFAEGYRSGIKPRIESKNSEALAEFKVAVGDSVTGDFYQFGRNITQD